MNVLTKVRHLLLSSEKKSALILLVLMLIGMAFETLGIGLVVPVLGVLIQDELAAKSSTINKLMVYFNNPDKSQIVLIVMLFLVGVYFWKNVFLGFLAWRQAKFSFGVQRQLSQRLFNLYLGQSFTFHLQRNTALLINNITTETSLFALSISAFLLIFTESLVVIGVTCLLMLVEPLGALVALSVLGVAGFSFLRLTKTRVTKLALARQYHESMRLQHLQQGLGGIKDVLLLGRANHFQNEYQIHNIESAKAAEYQNVMLQMPRLWLEFLAITGLALLVIVMIKHNGEMSSIVPTLGLFAAAAFRLLPSANRILNSIQSVRYGIPTVNTLFKEINLKNDLLNRSFNPQSSKFQLIQLRDLSFTYPNATAAALTKINLKIEKGAAVGFIGESGSGKSTLVDIIMGLLVPVSGTVSVDNQNIFNNIQGWQNQIGYVPQSIYLTDDSLRKNVAFGIPENLIDDEAVTSAINAAQLGDFVSSLPDGLDTVVGERGVRLSGGQRQRIGIARALYHDPEILVLDEATSALDNETELGLMKAINALHGTKTLIIVAHRLSTIEGCDRVYRFANGFLVEETTPSQVLAQNRQVNNTNQNMASI